MHKIATQTKDSTSVDGTCSRSSGSDSLQSFGDFSKAAQTNAGQQNLSSMKEDHELVGMLGEIVGLLEDAKALSESFGRKEYCKVGFMVYVNDFVTELKEKFAQEEQERLQNRKVTKILLDCCRYLSRQALAFRGGASLFHIHFASRLIADQSNSLGVG